MAKIDLITHYDTLSPISEGYRAIRINLQFAGADKTLQVVGVTSSSPGKVNRRPLQTLLSLWHRTIRRYFSLTVICVSRCSIKNLKSSRMV